MRRIFLKYAAIVFVFSISCIRKQKDIQQPDYTGFRENRLPLIGFSKKDRIQNDTLCYVSINTPARLDTFYTWEDYSDYVDAEHLKYRFSDTRYDQYAESGFIKWVEPDSLYQLTIWHKRYKQVPDSINLPSLRPDQKEEKWFHQTMRLIYMDSIQYIIKEYKIINDRSFIIAAYTSKYAILTNRETLFVTAATNLTDRTIFFIGECVMSDTTGFINNIYKSILSIRIEEKKR